MHTAISKLKLSLVLTAFGILVGLSGCTGKWAKGGACCDKAMAEKKPGQTCCGKEASSCGEKKAHCGCEKCKKCGGEKAACSK